MTSPDPQRWRWRYDGDTPNGLAWDVKVIIEGHPQLGLLAAAIGRAITQFEIVDAPEAPPDSVELDREAAGSHGSAPAASRPLLPDPAVPARPVLPVEVDEGPALHPIDNPDVDALRAEVNGLDPVDRGWLGSLEADGRRRGLGWRDLSTLRRFSICRGLVDCLRAGLGPEDVRTLVAAAGLGELALMPAFELGHVVAAMSAAEAVRFAEMAGAA